MKKFLATVLLISITSFQSAAALIVFDPSNFSVNTITSGASTVSATANPITALQQTLDTVNKTILIPMRDILTIMQIMQNSKMMTALIQGSLGSAGLLVTNPELYLKNQVIAVTQGGIDTLARQNSIFGNSIIGAVVNSAKFNNSSLTLQLNSINRSNIPAVQQANTCNDTQLSALAKSQVAAGADYTAKKAQLYNSLCACNPNADSADGRACAQRLMTLSNQRPSLDTFYLITQGDNAYTKAELSKIAIANDAATKQAQAKADLASGGGIKSQTTCTQKASNGLCISQTIEQASSVLNDAFKKALGSGLDTAISSIGSGAGSLIGTIFTTISLINGISTAIGGSASGGGGGNTTSIPTTQSTNTTYSSTAGFTQDLVNNAQTKAILSSAPMDQLNFHKKALTDLTTTDNSYISAIDSYNVKLDSLTSCFDSLTRDFPDDTGAGTQYGTRVTSAKNFASNTKNTNLATKASLVTELGKISTTSTLVNNTINTIQTSNSTAEITTTFQNYQNQVKTQGLPDLTAGISREGDRVMFTTNVQISTIDGGQYFNFNADCNSIRQEINSRNQFQGAGM